MTDDQSDRGQKSERQTDGDLQEQVGRSAGSGGPRTAEKNEDPETTGTVTLHSSVISHPASVISPAHAAILAGIIALLWVVHPLNTQAVTYIIQRGESMMGLFYLLTLYCFIRAVDGSEALTSDHCSSGRLDHSPQSTVSGLRFALARSRSARPLGVRQADLPLVHPMDSGPVSGLLRRRSLWLTASVVFCALGMATKPIMATAPLMVLVYDRFFIAGSFRLAWQRRRSYFACLASTWLLIPLVLYMGRSDWSGSAGFDTETMPWDVYAVSQPRVILRYLRLAVHPVGLCLDYTWPVSRGVREIAPSMLAVSLLLFTVIWAWRRNPPLAFLGVWFFGILAMSSSVLPVADLAVEHRMYLPLIAPIALTVLCGHLVLGNLMARHDTQSRLITIVATGLVVVMATALARLTIERNKDYHDQFAMWAKISEQRPHNYRAQTVIAGFLIDRKELDAAIALAKYVVTERDPGYFPAHYKLALAYYTKGRDEDAWRHLEKTLSIYPSHAESHNMKGLIRYRQGRAQEAADFYTRAIALDPYRAKYHHNLGLALMKGENWSAATTAFRDETKLQPDAIESYHGLGYVLARQGQYNDAVRAWRRALEINPKFWPTVYELAWVLATCPEDDVRNGSEALMMAQRLPFHPSQPNPATLEVLAAAYAETGKFNEAIQAADLLQGLPMPTGTSLIPPTERAERLALYRAHKPYRLQLKHGDHDP